MTRKRRPRNELVASGKGMLFEPRPGRLMKEWVVLPEEGANWVELAKETCAKS